MSCLSLYGNLINLCTIRDVWRLITQHVDEGTVQSLRMNNDSFVSISTTLFEVYDTLAALKIRKASGLDDLSPGLLKFCAAGIAPSLAVLFNRSFSEGVFPSECFGCPGVQEGASL